MIGRWDGCHVYGRWHVHRTSIRHLLPPKASGRRRKLGIRARRHRECRLSMLCDRVSVDVRHLVHAVGELVGWCSDPPIRVLRVSTTIRSAGVRVSISIVRVAWYVRGMRQTLRQRRRGLTTVRCALAFHLKRGAQTEWGGCTESGSPSSLLCLFDGWGPATGTDT